VNTYFKEHLAIAFIAQITPFLCSYTLHLQNYTFKLHLVVFKVDVASILIPFQLPFDSCYQTLSIQTGLLFPILDLKTSIQTLSFFPQLHSLAQFLAVHFTL